MSLFLALKVVHVMAAILAVGTSVTSTLWLARAGRDRDQWRFDRVCGSAARRVPCRIRVLG